MYHLLRCFICRDAAKDYLTRSHACTRACNVHRQQTADIKIIDFGSACYITDHLGSYVQSRTYRAPEVILGARCSTNPSVLPIIQILSCCSVHAADTVAIVPVRCRWQA